MSAQDSTDLAFNFQAVQIDFVVLPLNLQKGAVTISWSGTVNIDLLESPAIKYGSAGLQLGISQFWWPDISADEKYVHEHGYDGTDYDFLLRYSFPFSSMQADILTGLTIRNAEYYSINSVTGFEDAITWGGKIGGTLTYMLFNPGIGIRFKANCLLFGHKTIEAGQIGLGLVYGWQREE
jgi:hypothetical protein